mmetsp:Transcript_41733/g.124808  ORF Transcript_41733/g.124808 Transcript_41733/m.124808 type:complete len:212 (+) Transcript_41733:3642-4277(+)
MQQAVLADDRRPEVGVQRQRAHVDARELLREVRCVGREVHPSRERSDAMRKQSEHVALRGGQLRRLMELRTKVVAHVMPDVPAPQHRRPRHALSRLEAPRPHIRQVTSDRRRRQRACSKQQHDSCPRPDNPHHTCAKPPHHQALPQQLPIGRLPRLARRRRRGRLEAHAVVCRVCRRQRRGRDLRSRGNAHAASSASAAAVPATRSTSVRT